VVTGAGVQQVLGQVPQVQQPAIPLVQPLATQQALQQDPTDPSKWQVVQVAAAPQVVQAAQPQIWPVPAVQAAAAPAVAAAATPVKTRLRRVACTCPNCKDGDRSRK